MAPPCVRHGAPSAGLGRTHAPEALEKGQGDCTQACIAARAHHLGHANNLRCAAVGSCVVGGWMRRMPCPLALALAAVAAGPDGGATPSRNNIHPRAQELVLSQPSQVAVKRCRTGTAPPCPCPCGACLWGFACIDMQWARPSALTGMPCSVTSAYAHPSPALSPRIDTHCQPPPPEDQPQRPTDLL